MIMIMTFTPRLAKKCAIALAVLALLAITPNSKAIDGEAACNACQAAYDQIMDQCPYRDTDPSDPECVGRATEAKIQCQLVNCIY